MTRVALFVVFVVLALTRADLPAAAQETRHAQASSRTTQLTEVLKSRVPSGIKLLEDLALTKPGEDVPTDLAKLSGAWKVKLSSERTGSLMGEFVYVFEKLAPDVVTIVSMGIGRDPGPRGGQGNWGMVWATRYQDLKPAQVVPLQMTNTRGNTYTFTLRPDGKLDVRSVESGRSPWSGTAERITW